MSAIVATIALMVSPPFEAQESQPEDVPAQEQPAEDPSESAGTAESAEPLVPMWSEPVGGEQDFQDYPPLVPVEEAPVNVDFDLEVARRKLEAEFATEPDALEVEEALEVVQPDVLDDSVVPMKLRGSNESMLDLRSLERFFWQCRSELGRRDITLFGNGTVRLRSGLWSETEMFLDEIGPDLVLSYLDRLAKIARSRRFVAEAAASKALTTGARGQGHLVPDQAFGALDGRWTEACRLQLRLPDMKPADIWLPRMEVQSLEMAQLVAIGEELAQFTRPVNVDPGLGADYIPVSGDLLRRQDGQLFRVVGITTDGGGIELESLAEPVRIFYLLEDLPTLFKTRERAGALAESPSEGREPEIRELTNSGDGR